MVGVTVNVVPACQSAITVPEVSVSLYCILPTAVAIGVAVMVTGTLGAHEPVAVPIGVKALIGPTVAVAVLVQLLASTPVTVYVVIAVGVAFTVFPVVTSRFVL